MTIEDLYRLLRTTHIQAQGVVDTIVDPLLVLDGSLCIQSANRSFYETFKIDRDETVGQHIYEVSNGQWDIPDLRRLLMDVIPKSMAVINYEVEHNFPALGQRTMLLTARTLYHPDRSPHLLLLSFVDATDSRDRDAMRDMLNEELRHRLNNLLAVAQSMARMTTTKDRSAEEYRNALMGRLHALAVAQELAFSAPDVSSDLHALTERVLAPHKGAVVIEGDAPVVLGPGMLQPLSLVLHELETNAAKYGALSVSGGQVRITWGVEEANRLRLSWVECAGPPVTRPTVTGYGTKLLKSIITQGLKGRLELKYKVNGLEAEIVIPLRSDSPQ